MQMLKTKIKKKIKRWIDHKKYVIKDDGWFFAFIGEPWEDWVEIPFGKAVEVAKWIPKLWNVKSWEGEDLLVVMDYQLSRLQKAQQEDPYHCEENDDSILIGPKYAKVIQEARDCIKRILEDGYCVEEWRAHDKKYGKLRMLIGKVAQRDKDGKPLAYKCEFKPDSKAANKSRDKLHKLADKRKKDDYTKLFRIIKRDIEKWWT